MPSLLNDFFLFYHNFFIWEMSYDKTVVIKVKVQPQAQRKGQTVTDKTGEKNGEKGF